MARLLSLQEAAQMVGLKPQALRRATERGELPAFKICARVRIAETDLREWVVGNRIARTQPRETRP
jgi:excisionase family DNA binding protein